MKSVMLEMEERERTEDGLESNAGRRLSVFVVSSFSTNTKSLLTPRERN
jgi:hypothetical protein